MRKVSRDPQSVKRNEVARITKDGQDKSHRQAMFEAEQKRAAYEAHKDKREAKSKKRERKPVTEAKAIADPETKGTAEEQKAYIISRFAKTEQDRRPATDTAQNKEERHKPERDNDVKGR